MRSVLNVGGHNKSHPMPEAYQGWKHLLLDIDPRLDADITMDARELSTLNGPKFDSVFCSHNLEHYYHHEVKKVLAGFLHVMADDGFAFIVVPDLEDLMATVAEKKLDLDDVLYESRVGPIMVRDLIFGYGKEIEASGQDFYAHKTGFTRKSLVKVLKEAGFHSIYSTNANMEIVAYAFKNRPTDYALELLSLDRMG
ncbi:MAG: class I SAM-dependent methyltransferase [Magnetococcales bacterium]|nr:class I SAM-dependent methyltransferase [Magnetococcales bacterium]